MTIHYEPEKRWLCAPFDIDGEQHDWEELCFFANTEADGRAKMLIYLLEQKLTKPPDFSDAQDTRDNAAHT